MVVVILPDGGRSYLSKIYSDALDAPVRLPRARGELTVGDVLARKRDAGEIPPLVTVETHHQVRDAVALLHEHRVSQLPVVSRARPARRSSARSASAGCSSAPPRTRRCSTPRSST